MTGVPQQESPLSRAAIAQCERALDEALTWVTRNVAQFSPFHGDGSLNATKAKGVVELAVMALVYRCRAPDDARLGDVVELLRAVQRRRAFTDYLVRSPRHFVVYASFYGLMRRLGHDDPEQRALVQRTVAADFPRQIERMPNRAMDVKLALDWAQIDNDLPSVAELAPSSIAGRVPNTILVDDSSIYALTHVLLFAYAFGTRFDVPDAIGANEGLSAAVCKLLGVAAEAEQWDLLGELLLCADCLGATDAFWYARGWETFLAQQGADGAFRGPKKAPVATPRSKPGSPAAEAFARDYHTTLVAILALCARLGSAEAPRLGSGRGGALRARTGPSGDTAFAAPAREWIRDLFARVSSSGRPRREVLFGILLADWICDSVESGGRPCRARLAPEVAEVLAGSDERAERRALPLVPSLAALRAGVLLAADPASRGAGESILRSNEEALAELSERRIVPPAALFEHVLVLSAAGRGRPPQVGRYAGLVAALRALPTPAPRDDLAELALQIDRVSLCGTRAVGLGAGDAWVGELLSCVAAHRLREYDLSLGAKLVRALSYLGLAGTDATCELLGFLRLQQRPEGCFGFFGPEEPVLRRTLEAESSLPEDLDLPVTVSCLLALAEAGAGWRMAAALAALPSFAPVPAERAPHR